MSSSFLCEYQVMGLWEGLSSQKKKKKRQREEDEIGGLRVE